MTVGMTTTMLLMVYMKEVLDNLKWVKICYYSCTSIKRFIKLKKVLILLLLILFQGCFISSSHALSWQDYNELGDKMHKAGWYKDAVDYYNKAIGIKPNESIIYFNRGVSKYSLKDYNGAIADFEYTIYLNPNDNVARPFLSMAKENVAKHPVKTVPKSYTVQHAQPVRQPSWQDYYKNGEKHANQKNYKAALSDFTNAIKLNPNNADSYAWRGAMYAAIENYNASIKDLDTAIGINPNNANLYQWRGMVREKIEAYEEAISDYQQSLNISPNKDVSDALSRVQAQVKEQQREEIKKKISDNAGSLMAFLPILLVLLLGVIINPIKPNINTFNKYSQEEVKNRYESIYKGEITLNSPPPSPTSFGIKSNIKSLEQAYTEVQYIQRFCKSSVFESFDDNDKLGITLIGISCGITWFVTNYITNSIAFWQLALISSIVLYKPVKYLFVQLAISKIHMLYEYSDTDAKYYLLYKGVNDYFISNMDVLRKKTEEAKEKKLSQQYNYWKNYWNKQQKNGFKFEEAVGELYRKLGYKVKITKCTGDGGVDLIFKKDSQKIIVQCKAYKHQAGPEPVRALWGVKDDFRADSALFIAYAGVTTGAREFAIGKDIKFVELNDLISLSMQAYPEKGYDD